MKKILLLILVFFILSSVWAQKRKNNVYPAFSAYTNVSITSLKDYPDSTPRVNPSVSISLRVHSFEFELIYGRQTGNSALTSSGYEYRVYTDFNYLQTNYLFVRNINNHHLKLGFFILASSPKNTEHYSYQILEHDKIIYENSGYFEETVFTPDLGIMMGYEYEILNSLFVNTSLNWTNNAFNNILKLSIGLKYTL